MSYRGLMDGWHGDEEICDGFCNRCCYCEDCERAYDNKADQDYEASRYED